MHGASVRRARRRHRHDVRLHRRVQGPADVPRGRRRVHGAQGERTDPLRPVKGELRDLIKRILATGEFIFGYFWLFLVIFLVIFGYFRLFPYGQLD